jgi:glycosyltransferase involved in cell wall biosynthesis
MASVMQDLAKVVPPTGGGCSPRCRCLCRPSLRAPATEAQDFDRGAGGIAFLVGVGLFTIVAAPIEIGMVLFIMGSRYRGAYAGAIMLTFVAYALFTLVFTAPREPPGLERQETACAQPDRLGRRQVFHRRGARGAALRRRHAPRHRGRRRPAEGAARSSPVAWPWSCCWPAAPEISGRIFNAIGTGFASVPGKPDDPHSDSPTVNFQCEAMRKKHALQGVPPVSGAIHFPAAEARAERRRSKDSQHNLKAPADRIAVAPCGFDPQECWPAPGLARKALGLDPREFVVLRPGRMVPRKGVDTAIRSIAMLRDDFLIGARLLVVGSGAPGDGRPGPEIARMQALSRELGLEQQACITGQKPRAELRHYDRAANGMGREGLRRVHQRYTWRSVASRIARVCNSVLAAASTTLPQPCLASAGTYHTEFEWTN